jgi:hypothetical protein
MPNPHGTWWTARPADNPLRRPVDRRQRRASIALALAAALLLPVAGWLAGAWIYHVNAEVERAEQATRHRVGAVLTGDSTLHPGGRPYVVSSAAPATWRAPDGTQRTAEIASRPGALAGSTQPLWVDDSGAPVSPPQSRTQTVLAVAVVEFLTVLAAGSLVAVTGWLLRRRFDRQRYALWDAEWARMDEQNPV